MRRIGILTSGEDVPGMNVAVRAVVCKGIYEGLEAYKINYGFAGLVAGNIHRLDVADVGDRIQRGGTLLYPARYPGFAIEGDQLKGVEQLKKFRIEGLVVIGGDDSYHDAMALTKREFPAVGIPGTIDSNIPGTDFTISFDITINTVLESTDRIRNTTTFHVRIFVIEVIGRNAGGIVLWSDVAGEAGETIAPECDFDMASVVRKIQEGRDCGKKHCLVILVEGIVGGNELVEKLLEFGSYHTRVSILGRAVRGGILNTRDHILTSKFGTYAIELLQEGKGGLCVGIHGSEIVAAGIINTLENNKYKPDLSLYDLNNSLLF